MIHYPRLRWGRTPAGNKWAAHLQSCFESIVNPVRKMDDVRNCPLPSVLVKWRSLVRGMRQSSFFRIFNNLVIFIAPLYIHNTCCFSQSCAALCCVPQSGSHDFYERGDWLFIQRCFVVFLSLFWKILGKYIWFRQLRLHSVSSQYINHLSLILSPCTECEVN